MRINPYIQVQQMYNTKKAGTAKKAGSAGRTDDVMISSIGKDIQTAKQAVAAAPDVRTDIVEPIKSAVQNGTYEVSGASFADKLLRAAGEI
ncbi:MAG: flagellar biosynthesis anti-sigma factor FlgM [Lachnospiraceae bacterium]|nr:flagellar biosynthesis anti-sigma factor FlgM [Lachnospiraceae bacterium]